MISNPFSFTTSAVATSIAMTGGFKFLSCNQCNTPVAELVGSFLVIKSTHHGEKHTSVFNLLPMAMAVAASQARLQ